MAQIGTFTKTPDGSYVGEIITLSVQAKNVRIVPEDLPGEDLPNYRVTVGRAEIGNGRVKGDHDGRVYLEVMLDDPSFTDAIHANLIDNDDGKTARLIWSRRSATVIHSPH
jgi:uncharacterized protein (DUF736 family)